MTKKAAVLVIHGMGKQTKSNPDATHIPTYSKDLMQNVRRTYGFSNFDTDVAWHEVFFADIYQTRQDSYIQGFERNFTSMGLLRRFVMNKIADAAGYYPSKTNGSSYDRVHSRVTTTLTKLDQDTEENAPLIVLCHSLGAYIMSNYIYDVQKHGAQGDGDFMAFKTLRKLVTFGANIPVFMFAQKEPIPIAFHGTGPKPMPWWINMVSGGDPLGYPLGPLGGKYGDMVAQGEIDDRRVYIGLPVISALFALDHNAYWRSRPLLEQVVSELRLITGRIGGKGSSPSVYDPIR